MAGLEQLKKKLSPLLDMNQSLRPDLSIDCSASYKVRLIVPFRGFPLHKNSPQITSSDAFGSLLDVVCRQGQFHDTFIGLNFPPALIQSYLSRVQVLDLVSKAATQMMIAPVYDLSRNS